MRVRGVGGHTFPFERLASMKTVSYKSKSCLRCRQYRSTGGARMSVIESRTWAISWVQAKVIEGDRFWYSESMCFGCVDVGVQMDKVLAVFLCKLGIKVKGFSSELTYWEAYLLLCKENGIDPRVSEYGDRYEV